MLQRNFVNVDTSKANTLLDYSKQRGNKEFNLSWKLLTKNYLVEKEATTPNSELQPLSGFVLIE